MRVHPVSYLPRGGSHMRTLLLSTLLAVGLAGPAVAQNYHRGYVTRNGTYVAPHWQSTPDRSYNNNWSVRPNVNS